MSEKKTNQDPKDVVYYDEKRRSVKITVEKRLLNRIPVEREIFLTASGQRRGQGLFLDLSGGGAKLKTEVSLNKGDILEISASAEDISFIIAEVVRVERKINEYGLQWLKIIQENMPKGFLSKKKL